MADFELIVDIDRKLSYDNFQNGIADIISKLNSKPYEIELNISKGSIEKIKNDLQSAIFDIYGGGGKKTTGEKQISDSLKNGVLKVLNEIKAETKLATKSLSEMIGTLKSINDKDFKNVFDFTSIEDREALDKYKNKIIDYFTSYGAAYDGLIRKITAGGNVKNSYKILQYLAADAETALRKVNRVDQILAGSGDSFSGAFGAGKQMVQHWELLKNMVDVVKESGIDVSDIKIPEIPEIPKDVSDTVNQSANSFERLFKMFQLNIGQTSDAAAATEDVSSASEKASSSIKKETESQKEAREAAEQRADALEKLANAEEMVLGEKGGSSEFARSVSTSIDGSLRSITNVSENTAQGLKTEITRIFEETEDGEQKVTATVIRETKDRKAVREAEFKSVKDVYKNYYNSLVELEKKGNVGGEIAVDENGVYTTQNQNLQDFVNRLNAASKAYAEQKATIDNLNLSEEQRNALIAEENTLQQKLNEVRGAVAQKKAESDQTTEYKRQLDALKDYYSAMNTLAKSGYLGGDITDEGNGTYATKNQFLQDFVNRLNAASKAYTEQKATIDNLNLSEEQRNALIAKEAEIEQRLREEFAKKNKSERDKIASSKMYTSATREATAEIQRLEAASVSKNGVDQQTIDKLRELNTAFEKAIVDYKSGEINIDQLNDAYQRLKSGIDEAKNKTIEFSGETKSIGERIKETAASFGIMLSARAVFTKLTAEIRKAVQEVIKLDDALTQLQIVTRSSDAQMSAFGERAIEAADRLGASATDFISGATTYARLGYTMNEAAQLSEYTTMLQQVGNIDTQRAQDAITSIIKAFGKSPEEIEDVMNKLVAVGNNFPISVSQIAEGMTNVSSTMAAAGNTFEESVALLTAANTTVQNASKAATGLRTITARLRNTTADLDELGEEMTEAKYDELVQVLTDTRVRLTDINGEYRSTYDIMQDIAAVWDSLDSGRQSAIATAVAGTRMQAVFFSIIEQFKEASGAYDKMVNDSEGALDKAYGDYLDTATAHINQMKNAFTGLANVLVSSGLIGKIADFATTVLNLVTKIQKLHLLIPGIITAISGIKFAKTLSQTRKSLTAITNELLNTKSVLSGADIVTDKVKTSIANLTNAQRKALAVEIMRQRELKALNDEQTNALLNALGYTATTKGLKDANIAAAASNKILSTSFRGLVAAIKMNPIGAILTGVSLASFAISFFKDRAEEAAQAAQEAREKAIENAEAAASELKDLRGLYDAYEKAREEYRKGTGSKEALEEATESLVEKLKDEGVIVRGLADDYERLRGEVDNVTGEKLTKLAYGYKNAVEDVVKPNTSTIAGAVSTGAGQTLGAILGFVPAGAETIASAVGYLYEFNGELTSGSKEFAENISDGEEKIARLTDLFKGYSEGRLNYSEVKEMYELLYEYVNFLRAGHNTDWLSENLSKAMSLLDYLEERIDKAEEIGGSLAEATISNAVYKGIEDGVPKTLAEFDSAVDSIVGQIAEPLETINVGDLRARVVAALLDKIDDAGLRAEIMRGFVSGSMGKTGSSGNNSEESATDVADGFFGVFKDGAKESATDVADGFFGVFKDGAKGFELDSINSLIEGLSDEEVNILFNFIVSGEEKTPEQILEKIREIIEKRKELASDGTPVGISDAEANAVYANVEKVSSKLKTLAEIYKDVKDGGAFNWSNILNNEDFQKTFGTLDTYQHFIRTITESPDDINACQQAFNALATEYLRTSGALKNLTEEEKDAVVAMLESVGVVNAEEVVTMALIEKTGDLNAAKEYLEEKTKGVTAATIEEAANLANEEGVAEGVRRALANLWIVKVKLGEVTITTAADIDNLISLAKAAGASTKAMLQLAKAKAVVLKMDEVQAEFDAYGGIDMRTIRNLGGWEFIDSITSGEYFAEIDYGAYVGTGGLFNKQNGLDFNGSNVGTSGNSSSGGSSTGKDDDEKPYDWFTPKYKEFNHEINMERETQENYLKWLEWAYKEAYAQNIITLDDFNKYEEEVLKLRREIFDDYLSDIEHMISMYGNFDGDVAKQASLYKTLMIAVEAEIAEARKNKLKDTDTYLQKLLSKWSSYYKSYHDLMDKAESSAESSIKQLVDIRINMLKQDIKNQRDALKKQLDELKEFYSKQKEMLRDARDEEKYLEEQAEKRRSVAKIEAQLRALELDNSAWATAQKQKLREDLAKANKELDDFEREHALDSAEKMLDEQYKLQEKTIEKEDKLLEEKENNAEALYKQALEDIKSGSVELFNEMIEWNKVYGDGIRDTIVDKWEQAYKALKDYYDLYGSFYKDIVLADATGYNSGDSYDDMSVSGKGSKSGTEVPKPAAKLPPLPGDIDGDGVVSAGDARYAMRAAIGYKDAEAVQLEMGDVNHDGKITAEDARLIHRIALELEDLPMDGYASGTRSATPGIHRIDELGSETIFESANGRRYKMFSGGEKVLNARASDFLYSFANKGSELFGRIFGGNSAGSIAQALASQSGGIRIDQGDIIIQGNADMATVSEIRRAQRDSMNNLLKEFRRLGRA